MHIGYVRETLGLFSSSWQEFSTAELFAASKSGKN